MMKRIFALLLCVTLLAGVFTGCAVRDYGETGQSITVYLTNNVYDLDPANAYKNDALADVVGLMFDTLFVLDENGNVSPSLVKSYWIEENEIADEYKMFLRLKNTSWSDGVALTADDVVFAWQRLLEPDANFEAACLLYDIKNARDVKKGSLDDGSTITIDDVGISAPETNLLEIQFARKMTDADYDRFILNLTSVALAPLRDDIVDKKANPLTGRNEDWAKKGTTMVCSGPFKLTSIKWIDDSYDKKDYVAEEANAQIISDFTLERNQYYYRDPAEDSLFKSVLPQRICVDCTLTPEQLDEAFAAGMVLYVGNVPLSLRADESSAIAQAVQVAEQSLATLSVYLNQEVEPFNQKEVRQALSMAIDREALAKAVVYAEAATGLIPTAVFETTDAKATFREKCTEIYNTLKKDTDGAKELLKDINPKKYSFTLSCPAYDEIQCFVAEEIAAAWEDLGFKVTVQKVSTIANDDYYSLTESIPDDICDDIYAEMLQNGEFEAILFDACAYSADAYGLLAPYAQGFTGRAVDLTNDELTELPVHVTGFASEAYNDLINAICAESDLTKRADLYRQAEKMLMDEMPVIPVLFNLEASAKNDNLTGLDETFYVKALFEDAYIQNYDEYLEIGAEFIQKDYRFAEMKFHTSKDCAYTIEAMPEGGAEAGTRWDRWLTKYDEALVTFKKANSVYSHFFAAEKEAAETATE